MQLRHSPSLRLGESGKQTSRARAFQYSIKIKKKHLIFLNFSAPNNQMGSKMKPVIFSEHVATALRVWHRTAKKHVKNGHQSGSSTPFSSRPASPLHGGSSSPLYMLQGYKKSNYEEEHEVWGGRGDERGPPPTIRH